MTNHILVATTLACMSNAALAQSECNFSISQFNVGTVAQGSSYDVFNNLGLTSDIAIELTRDGDPSLASTQAVSQTEPTVADDAMDANAPGCSPELLIMHTGHLSQASDVLEYELTSQNAKPGMSNARLVLNDTSYAIGERRLYQIDVRFAAFQFVAAGEYTGNFNATVDEITPGSQGTLGAMTADDQATRRMTVSVPSAARLSLAGTQQRRQLVDFGILEADKRPDLPVALTVQSTASYQLKLTSENGGQLVRKGSTVSDGIAYETIVDNSRISLDAEAIISRSPTNQTGDSIPLSFRIIDVRGRRAGEYADRLTISVVPAITEN